MDEEDSWVGFSKGKRERERQRQVLLLSSLPKKSLHMKSRCVAVLKKTQDDSENRVHMMHHMGFFVISDFTWINYS